MKKLIGRSNRYKIIYKYMFKICLENYNCYQVLAGYLINVNNNIAVFFHKIRKQKELRDSQRDDLIGFDRNKV